MNGSLKKTCGIRSFSGEERQGSARYFSELKSLSLKFRLDFVFEDFRFMRVASDSLFWGSWRGQSSRHMYQDLFQSTLTVK
jgi:hypothetical protein